MAGPEFSPNSEDYPPGYLAEYKGGQLIATSVIFIVLNIIFFGLRLYARRVKRAPADLDDWFLWPALIVNVAVCLEAIFLIKAAGVGYHLAAVKLYSPHKLEIWSKGIFACVWLWALAVALPKLSILAFYLRFFTTRIERTITYMTMMVVAATFIATGLTTTFQCSPVAYQWNKKILGGNCIDVLAFYRWMSFPNIATDIVGLLLPLPMIWRLHTTRHKKLGITVMFVTGSAGLVTSVIRFVMFFSHDAFEDNTWTSVELLKWTDIEPGIYFIAACMPSLRPLLRLAREKAFGSTRSKQNDSSSRDGGSGQPIRLANFSFGRDGERNGFARLGGGDQVGKETPKGSDVKGGDATAADVLPEDGIAVRKDIWVVNHAA